MNIRPALLLVSIALLGIVAACDPQRVEKLEEGVATEADVRRQFGEPSTVTIEPDGSKTFEYPRQPEGWTNYEIKLGPDGRMSSLRQLLNEDNFARIAPGMDQLEVRKRLGRPAKTTPYVLKNEEVWDWRFKQHGQDSRVFSVTFDASKKVVGTSVGDDPRETSR